VWSQVRLEASLLKAAVLFLKRNIMLQIQVVQVRLNMLQSLLLFFYTRNLVIVIRMIHYCFVVVMEIDKSQIVSFLI